MNLGYRFGIPAYTFIFEQQHQLLGVTFLCMSIISESEIKFSKLLIYISLIPIILIYPLLQKFFIKGSLEGGVKE